MLCHCTTGVPKNYSLNTLQCDGQNDTGDMIPMCLSTNFDYLKF